ncbi:group 2 allergen Blo t 2-like isoform 1 [Leptotrombidium deliense]|uniref:Group 2 allergen Blo t 2-like isoform 1 n=1 Tax=Leptotrombidium deliense TaxID=299467 RepID=A0A443SIN3_9ACAR|nr:group 2 allergen Blo t 2-like isoform 1 [Leptotrombidium deliense]
MSRAVLLLVLFGCVFAKDIKFKDCANGELKSVDVDPCDSDPCVFKKGRPVTLKAKFVANHNVENVELKATIDLEGIDIKYPGLDSNGCNYLSCPLVQGKEYELVYKVPVMQGLADMRSSMKWVLTGKETRKVLGCAEVEFEVQS